MDHYSTCPLQICDKVQSRHDKSTAIMGRQKRSPRAGIAKGNGGWRVKTALNSVNRRLHDHLSGKYCESLNATDRNGVQISSDFNVTA
jgi:hypothetical protein